MSDRDWWQLILTLYFLKGMLVGSDFNFVRWFQYGKRYTNWYFGRERFKP